MSKQVRKILAQGMGRKNKSFVEQAIGLYPDLKPFIDEWPDLVNSLIDTKHQNYLVSDGSAYVSPDISFSPDNYSGFLFQLDAIHPFTPYVWNIHGCADRPACCVGFSPNRQLAYANGRTAVESIPASALIGQPLRFVLDMGQGIFSVGHAPRVSISNVFQPLVTETFTPEVPTRSSAMRFFNWLPSGAPFQASIAQAIIVESGTEHRFVPFRKADGDCGLLDVATLRYYGNASTKGSFTIAVK